MKYKVSPVQRYNEMFFDDAMLIFRTFHRTIMQIDEHTYSVVKNKRDMDTVMFVEDRAMRVLKCVEENGLDIPKGTVMTAFEILMNFRMKGMFNHAMNHVNKLFCKHKMPFVRVGVDYYMTIHETDNWGIPRTRQKTWTKGTLNDDYCKEDVAAIAKYYDFTNEPNNWDYQQVVEGKYNRYAPFDFTPKAGGWGTIEDFVRHIFGENEDVELPDGHTVNYFELGIRYLKCLLDHPTQKLPILVLTSTERSTGKSTFVNFLCQLFGDNSVVLNPADLASDFNASYAWKNLLCIEESTFDSKAVLEKLKNLSTQQKITVNDKGVSHYSLPFHGKLIITSNDERKFSKVDVEEIRYWIRKVPTLKGKGNDNILADMMKEIPAFLDYIRSQPELKLGGSSRQLFQPWEIYTDALKTVKEESLSSVHKTLNIHLADICSENRDVETFYLRPSDVKKAFFRSNGSVQVDYIKTVLSNEMKLEYLSKSKKISRITAFINEGYDTKKQSGFGYIFPNPLFGTLDDDDTSNDKF